MSGAGVSTQAFAGMRRRARSASAVVDGGLAVAVVVLFGVSGGMLWLVGYNYDGLTGSPITKIHPFTYLVGVLVVWRAMASGNPVGFVVHAAERKPATMLMAMTGLMMLAITVLRKGPGMAGFVDTYVGPALLVFLLFDAGERTMHRLAVLLHLLMSVNAVMALFEFATRTLIFPYRLDGAVFATDLRSTALQGHPLVNASLTACYILALLSGGRTLPNGLRLLMIALQCAAMVTFGGRSGMIVTLVFGGGYLVVFTMRSLQSRRVPLLGAAIGILLMATVPVVVGAAGATGFFDALLLRFSSDGGSANARVEMLDLFKAIPLRELIVGPDIGLVESLRRINGLEWGIENPIIRTMLYQGAFLTLVLMIVFGLWMAELARDRERGVWLPVIGCLILLNTAESIGAKTTLLAKFVIIVVCLYRRRQSAGRSVPANARAAAINTASVRPAASSGPGPR